jgi:DNA-binding NarL/FixJ family response regulator
VLSQHGELVYALELFARGTNRRAYLLKDRIRESAELARAIRAVAGGRSLVDPQIVDQLVGTRRQSPAAVAGLTRLTPREQEILALVADGRSNGAIARTLGVTKRAVERHINGIFMKLDVGDGEDVSRRVKATLLYLARPPE